MTRPIAFGCRIGRQWYVCFAGRFGVGVSLDEACAAARGAS